MKVKGECESISSEQGTKNNEPPAEEVCDATHLKLCQNKGDCEKYGVWDEENKACSSPVVLNSIVITTPATKLVYTVGNTLDISGLVVTGTYSDGSTKPETITDANVIGFDSSSAVTGQVLTITVDGKTATYTIDVVAPLSSAKAITAFGFTTLAATGVIGETNHTIAVTVPAGTDVTNLSPTIEVSDKASVSPNSGVAQNFTNPVTYTVTAEDSSTQNYTVTVTVE